MANLAMKKTQNFQSQLAEDLAISQTGLAVMKIKLNFELSDEELKNAKKLRSFFQNKIELSQTKPASKKTIPQESMRHELENTLKMLTPTKKSLKNDMTLYKETIPLLDELINGNISKDRAQILLKSLLNITQPNSSGEGFNINIDEFLITVK